MGKVFGNGGRQDSSVVTPKTGISQVMTQAKDLDNLDGANSDVVIRPPIRQTHDMGNVVNTENLARALAIVAKDLGGGLDGIAMIANKLSYLDMVKWAKEVTKTADATDADIEALAKKFALWARARAEPEELAVAQQ